MSTRTKIKIKDDIELRSLLDAEYERSSQIKLCKYALLLATHILILVKYDDMDNPAIKTGYAINERWQKGEATTHEVRQAGFQIHRLARNSQDIILQTALRVVGQAVATAHMKEHAMVASDYAIKVMNLKYPDNNDAIRQERLWQIENLRGKKDADISV